MLDNMNYSLQPIKVIFLPFFSFFWRKHAINRVHSLKRGKKKEANKYQIICVISITFGSNVRKNVFRTL